MPGVSSLPGPVPAGVSVWVLAAGGMLLVIGTPTLVGDVDWAHLGTGQTTMPRTSATSTSISMTSGLLRLTYFTATRTEPVVKVRVLSGAVGAGATPTLCRVGLYTVDDAGDLALAGSAPSDTSMLAAANTAYTKSLSAAAATVAGRRYALGLLVVTAATVPQVCGFAGLPLTELAISPRITGCLTGQTDLPATIPAGSVGTSAGAVYGALLPS